MFLDYQNILEKALSSRISPLSLESPVNPLWITSSLAICFFWGILRRRQNSSAESPLLKYVFQLFPQDYFSYRFIGLDLLFWFFGILLFSIFLMLDFPFSLLRQSFEMIPIPKKINAFTGSLFAKTIIWTFIYALFQDFGNFIAHKILHENSFLWEFHKVHHYPRVLGPFTFLRVHPVELMFRTVIITFFTFFALFLVHPLFAYQPEVYICGASFFWVFSNTYNNFSHSHCWVHWPLLCYLFRSPAMHLMHHRKKSELQAVNYSNIFAIWDLIFGSIEVPDTLQYIEFGIDEKKQQPYESLWGSMTQPFKEINRRFANGK